MHYYIGTDIGTTSTKSVLFDHQNNVVNSSYQAYPLYNSKPMVAEQDPVEIYQAVLKTIKEVVQKSMVNPQDIKFVAFSAAMHSLIPVDRSGSPLMNSMTWADTRASVWANKLKSTKDGMAIYHRTGTPIHPMSPLTKLLWLKAEEKEIFSKAYKFIGIKESVFYQLFGEYVIDYSLASATGMFNLKQLAWDKEVLSLIGISEEKLSRVVPTTQVMTDLALAWTSMLGLHVDTKFIMGASDGVLSNLGLGAVKKGDVALTIGTSGAIRTVVDQPMTDPEMRTFCYALTEAHWVVGGPVNNGGIVLKWVRDVLLNNRMSYDEMTALAAKAHPVANGLFFHPYLLGERAPLWNADAQGSFFGLGMHHESADLIRASLEGVIFNLYHVLDGLRDVIGDPCEITATGGFTRSALWRQILADIFNVEVNFHKSVESSCLGAVVLGKYAIGEATDLLALLPDKQSSYRHQPNVDHAEKYTNLIPIYLRLVETFKAGYATLKK